MVFRSKVDNFFIIFLIIIVLSIGALAFLPFVLDDVQNRLITTLILFIMIGFILWISFSIKYIFTNQYLLVKGGPIKSKILYENITKLSPTTDVFTGYRILSARDALEVYYKNAMLGSVKISPENKQEFIDELKKRCTNLQIKQ